MTSTNPSINEPTNIILILADDMGFSDLGCFGSEIHTPNLDRLAAQGMRFTQAYNCARCCPTRASMLTGLYPHQAGVGHMINDRGVGPAYQGYLRSDTVTLGEALSRGGYQTYYVGKWHASPGLPLLGEPPAALGSEENPIPTSRGFDRFYGTLAGCANYFNPHSLFDQEKHIFAQAENYYYTDDISTQACRMIKESRKDKKPFFLHVCYTAPHWPLHAPQENIENFRGKYRKGWDYFRTARHEELIASGILGSDWSISPRDAQSHDFFEESPQHQEWEDLRMAVYTAQIECMDRGIGQIIQQLKTLGVYENTLVIFLSDNGGCAEFLDEDGDGRNWPSLYQHTARPGEICTVGNIRSLQPGSAATFMSYDLPWANLSNTPFRLYKHWVHEGGIATPMIASWPKGIQKPGINHAVIHVIDFMATFLDIAGISYPQEYHEHSIQALEGESFLPALHGSQWDRERPVFWEHEGNRAVRDGHWKLASKFPGNWELYDMTKDRTELNDLANKNKPQVEKMVKSYNEWAQQSGVLPWERVNG